MPNLRLIKDEPHIDPLHVNTTFAGPIAMELRRVCANLDILPQTFIRQAVKMKLNSMGIIVD